MGANKQRDAWLKAQRAPRTREQQAYDSRHGTRMRLAVEWLCPQCWIIVAPFESHGHLT